jgi:hypothetical protein
MKRYPAQVTFLAEIKPPMQIAAHDRSRGLATAAAHCLAAARADRMQEARDLLRWEVGGNDVFLVPLP